MKLPIPVASDPTEILADWMEFEALRSGEKQTSVESLVRVIRRGGSADALEDPRGDAGSELSQQVAQDAFSEVEARARACGGDGYPFKIEQGLLRLKDGPEQFPYIFLLLLSATKPTTGHDGTAVLFEQLCTHAALRYLGGDVNDAKAIRFGSPRKPPLAMLCKAIDDLCIKLAEGGGCKSAAEARHTGDQGLDVVAWRDFPDLKAGKLVAFGQCAAGAVGWQNKLAELDGRKFGQKWFRQMLVVDPLCFFFVPRRIPLTDWEHAGIDAGILFDRCRIVACLQDMHADLQRSSKRAAKTLIRGAREG